MLALLGRTSRPGRQPLLPPFASRLRPHSRSQTLWPPRSIGQRCWLPHVFPLPPGKSRAAPGFALALRAIRLPDACGRLAPPVVLLWISRILLLPVFLLRASCTRGGLRSLYLILVSLVLLLGRWRPSIRIPADAENGNIPARPASRRSLSGTHFA